MTWSKANDRSDQTDDVLAVCLEIYLESRGPQGRTFSRLPSYRRHDAFGERQTRLVYSSPGLVDPQMMEDRQLNSPRSVEQRRERP